MFSGLSMFAPLCTKPLQAGKWRLNMPPITSPVPNRILGCGRYLAAQVENARTSDFRGMRTKPAPFKLPIARGLRSHRRTYTSRKISCDENRVRVPLRGNVDCQFHNFWLRDHCQCQSCLHEDTKQRLLDTFSIPKDIVATSVEPRASGLQITWNHGGHESLYPWDWLELHSYSPRIHHPSAPKVTLWGVSISKDPPSVQYDDVMREDEGVGEWTSKIREYGFCFVENTPVSHEKTKALIERIAFIRPTHYGAFWDFTADLSLKDTAYTTLPLPAHTDTTYLSDPAGLQLFHLLSHTGGSGGASLLVDGFHAASVLKNEHPDAYDVLSRVRVPSHASGNAGVSMRPAWRWPVLNHDPDGGGRLVQVRWNNDDRATMDEWWSEEEMLAWYAAAREWVGVLRRQEVEYWEQLRPGRPLIFDNWRVLHGRSAFTGKRRLCGGYINHDDFRSRNLMLNNSREDVLKAL